jgi:deoxycytidine triphosphate deaminase
MSSRLTTEEISIRLALDSGDPRAIAIQPGPAALTGTSISLHLHDSFMELSEDGTHRLLEAQQYGLQPQRFALGTTREVVKLPADIMGVLIGTTRLARLGLVVDGARLVDPGFTGRIALEIANFGLDPIPLAEGTPIAQLALNRVAVAGQRSPTLQSLVLDLSLDSVRAAGIFSVGSDVPIALQMRDGRRLFYPRSVSPIEVEHLKALSELERMLRDPALSERDLQSLFDDFPHLLVGPDYTEIRSQIVLRLKDGGALIPDFFLQPVDQRQLWDIADIKLPKFRTVVHQRHRARLSAAVMEGIAQLRTYSRYFDDAENRDRTKERHGITAYKPRLILVIGREEPNLSPVEWRAVESEAGDVKLLNYDQVVQLARHRLLDRPWRRGLY